MVLNPDNSKLSSRATRLIYVQTIGCQWPNINIRELFSKWKKDSFIAGRN